MDEVDALQKTEELGENMIGVRITRLVKKNMELEETLKNLVLQINAINHDLREIERADDTFKRGTLSSLNVLGERLDEVEAFVDLEKCIK